MNLKRAILVAAALLLAPVAHMYAQAGAAAPATIKVGILDVRQAIIGSAEGKQAAAELQSQFAPRQNELDNLRKQIEDVQQRLRQGERTLSDEEKGRLARQGDVWSRQFQRKTDELREDYQNAENDVIDRIGRKMRDVLDRFARENNYSVVFDVSTQGAVVYASTQIDITQEIVKLYDQAYPVRGGVPAPAQPGTPRPAPRPAPTKPPQK